jgi:hypothetical protein
VIQTLYPQTAATAPPETPLAEQQLLQQNVSTTTAPSNRSRLGRSTAGSQSFVPPRPVTTAPPPPPRQPATTAARTSHVIRLATPPPADNDRRQEIDHLAEALIGLEIIDLTQETDAEVENSEPTAALRVGAGSERSVQQQRHALAPARSTNWNTGRVQVSSAEVRPKRVVSGLFYRSAPSRQQQS